MAMLVDDVLHFSDPGTFNDPLDARPYVEVDVRDSVLVTVLRQLVKQRVTEGPVPRQVAPNWTLVSWS